MITIEASRTGVPVLKKDDRWLGSSIDPAREAQSWAERAHAMSRGGETLVVLGLGSGHHVSELYKLRSRQSVVVIENDREVIDGVLRIGREIEREDALQIRPTDIICAPEWMNLIDHERFRDLLGGVYRLATYGPSAQNDGYFKHVERLLLGRDKLSFLLLLKTRPELLAILNTKAIDQIAADEAISIKTLRRVFSPRAVASRERRLWRLLEELVI